MDKGKAEVIKDNSRRLEGWDSATLPRDYGASRRETPQSYLLRNCNVFLLMYEDRLLKYGQKPVQNTAVSLMSCALQRWNRDKAMQYSQLPHLS
jgi:hypothetical protein